MLAALVPSPARRFFAGVVLSAMTACRGGDGRTSTTAWIPGTSTAAASTGGPGTGSAGDAGTAGTAATTATETTTAGGRDAGEPPFTCTPPAADSPVLDAEFIFDPADPHPGDTLTVIVRSQNGTGRAEAPPMTLAVEGADGTATYEAQTIEGGDALYYYAVPDVPLGDLCLTTTIDGALEASAKVTVTPRPTGHPAAGGVYKIVEHHQWTCDEQPGFGNEVHVEVRDEGGAPVAGAVVEVRPADATDPASIYNGDVPIPQSVTTGPDGRAVFYDSWPVSDHGLLVLELRVAGVASDIATEITTGWWEDDFAGCSFCPPGSTKNVWGHWSHTVVFQLDPQASEACKVPTDHAGMAACPAGLRHIHHHPEVTACWPAGLAP